MVSIREFTGSPDADQRSPALHPLPRSLHVRTARHGRPAVLLRQLLRGLRVRASGHPPPCRGAPLRYHVRAVSAGRAFRNPLRARRAPPPRVASRDVITSLGIFCTPACHNARPWRPASRTLRTQGAGAARTGARPASPVDAYGRGAPASARTPRRRPSSPPRRSCMDVPGEGFEPTRLAAAGFKPAASAIPPPRR